MKQLFLFLFLLIPILSFAQKVSRSVDNNVIVNGVKVLSANKQDTTTLNTNNGLEISVRNNKSLVKYKIDSLGFHAPSAPPSGWPADAYVTRHYTDSAYAVIPNDTTSEWVARTIYVSMPTDPQTPGNDVTGNGTSVAPYATIYKALSSIKNKIYANITLQLDSGTFTFSTKETNLMNAKMLNSPIVKGYNDRIINIKGNTTKSPKPFVITAGPTTGVLKLSRVVPTDSLSGQYMSTDGASLYTVFCNWQDTIMGFQGANTYYVYNLNTTLNISDASKCLQFVNYPGFHMLKIKPTIPTGTSYTIKNAYLNRCKVSPQGSYITYLSGVQSQYCYFEPKYTGGSTPAVQLTDLSEFMYGAVVNVSGVDIHHSNCVGLGCGLGYAVYPMVRNFTIGQSLAATTANYAGIIQNQYKAFFKDCRDLYYASSNMEVHLSLQEVIHYNCWYALFPYGAINGSIYIAKATGWNLFGPFETNGVATGNHNYNDPSTGWFFYHPQFTTNKWYVEKWYNDNTPFQLRFDENRVAINKNKSDVLADAFTVGGQTNATMFRTPTDTVEYKSVVRGKLSSTGGTLTGITSYGGNYANRYTPRSLTDKNYVDSVASGGGGPLDSSKLVTQFDIQRGLIVTNSLNTYPGININTTHDYSYGLNVYTEGMAAIPIQGNSLYCDTLFLLKKWNNTKFLVDNIGNVDIKGQYKVNGIPIGSGGSLDSSKLVTKYDLRSGLLLPNAYIGVLYGIVGSQLAIAKQGLSMDAFSSKGSSASLNLIGGDTNRASISMLLRGYQQKTATDLKVNIDTSGITLYNSNLRMFKLDSLGFARHGSSASSDSILATVGMVKKYGGLNLDSSKFVTKMNLYNGDYLGDNVSINSPNVSINAADNYSVVTGTTSYNVSFLGVGTTSISPDNHSIISDIIKTGDNHCYRSQQYGYRYGSNYSKILEILTDSTGMSFINSQVEVAKIDSSGHIQGTAGNSTAKITVGGTLKDFYSDVTTSGTSETSLYSYTIPAKTLSNVGDKIVCNYSISTDNFTGGARIQIGSNTIGDLNYNAAGYPEQLQLTFIRVSSTQIKLIFTNFVVGSGIGGASLGTYDFDAGIPIVLKATGTTGSLTAHFGYIEYKPAAIN